MWSIHLETDICKPSSSFLVHRDLFVGHCPSGYRSSNFSPGSKVSPRGKNSTCLWTCVPLPCSLVPCSWKTSSILSWNSSRHCFFHESVSLTSPETLCVSQVSRLFYVFQSSGWFQLTSSGKLVIASEMEMLCAIKVSAVINRWCSRPFAISPSVSKDSRTFLGVSGKI